MTPVLPDFDISLTLAAIISETIRDIRTSWVCFGSLRAEQSTNWIDYYIITKNYEVNRFWK